MNICLRNMMKNNYLIHEKYGWTLTKRILGRYGIKDKSGNLICPIKYITIFPFYAGLAIVKYKENIFSKVKWGVIDENFYLTLFSEPYEEVFVLTHKLLAVKLNGRWGIIHRSGKFICKPKYSFCPHEFCNGFSTVQIGCYYAFINEDGIQICKAKYFKVRAFNERGIAEVCDEYGWKKLNKKGAEIKE